MGEATDGGRQGARRGRPAPDDGGAARHLKRYGAFYAIGVVIVLVAVVLPQLNGDDGGDGGGDGAVAAGETRSADDPWSPGSGDIEAGTGTTRGGVECEPGVPQHELSIFSPPCVPEFDGDNGGATFRGVSDDTIRIAVRSFPSSANQQAVRQEQEEAGYATPEVSEEIQQQFLDHFNETFELYGRTVELVPYESRFGDSTAEALGQGREGACQDATLIVRELDAYGVIGGMGGAGISNPLSAVFAECAAERELVVFQGASYYPETFYEDLHPYVWNVSMNCLTLNDHMAEYIGERLANKPAVFAGDPAMREQTRVFGAYSPDNEQYVECSEASRRTLQEEYDLERGSTFRYALDISRFNEQAQRAILQFKEDGVTTIVASADPISVGMMTSHAAEQDYFPEWVISGTAGLDQNNFGRQFDQEVVGGRLFGLSTLSSSEDIYGPGAEAPRLYAELNDGATIPKGTTGDFYSLVQLFTFLQAAGPDLTPETMATGVQTLPAMGGDGRTVWSWQDSHTATQDAREVYWDPDAEPGPEEPDQDASGSYVPTYDGRRFLVGEWPAEDPPIYPDR